MKKAIVLGVSLMFSCISIIAQSSVFINKGKAINGYDAVSYFTDGKPVQGRDDLVYTWNNANWYFVSAQHLDSFKLNPGRYAPQYGGYCAYGLSEGHKAPTDPAAWTIVDGKLYLNFNTGVREQWNKNRPERIESANKNWPGIKDKN